MPAVTERLYSRHDSGSRGPFSPHRPSHVSPTLRLRAGPAYPRLDATPSYSPHLHMLVTPLAAAIWTRNCTVERTVGTFPVDRVDVASVLRRRGTGKLLHLLQAVISFVNNFRSTLGRWTVKVDVDTDTDAVKL